ncbi:MAG: class II histone deacetylase, partial [Pseudomonadota bacterium]
MTGAPVGFFWDERSFWFSGGNYAFTQPVGGLVQPLAAGGLPENPETKRRFKNLMDVTGMTAHLA